MQFSSIANIAALLMSSTLAFPLKDPSPLINFLLVTTTQKACSSNSSLLANVSATSLFDPFHQHPYYLRLIGPGYLSLPRFNLTLGRLNSLVQTEFSPDLVNYRSAPLAEDQFLEFLPQEERGNLSLQNGYLLANNGTAEGWAICLGPLNEPLITWRASDETCSPAYVHAVEKPPY